jgi:hypothetical protein
MKPMTEQEELELLAENARLREKVSELNRRCQRAESAALKTVEGCKAQGVSIGRGLANWYSSKLQRERDALLKVVKWIATKHDLFFAECSQAEEIISRCKMAVEAAENKDKD